MTAPAHPIDQGAARREAETRPPAPPPAPMVRYPCDMLGDLAEILLAE